MKNFRNIIYSDIPPNVNDLWLKGTLNPDDPFEIKIFKNNKWETIDRGSISLEDSLGNSEESSMTQKAITDALNNLQKQISNISTNGVEITYDPIEEHGLGEDVSKYYNITLNVILESGVSDVQFYNNEEIINLVEGVNILENIYIDDDTDYIYTYKQQNQTILKRIKFKTTKPVCYGCSKKLQLSSLNNYFDTLQNKIVKDNINITLDALGKPNQFLYIIYPEGFKCITTSNGFQIKFQQFKIKSLLGDYNINECGPIKGPINNINIQITKNE